MVTHIKLQGRRDYFGDNFFSYLLCVVRTRTLIYLGSEAKAQCGMQLRLASSDTTQQRPRALLNLECLDIRPFKRGEPLEVTRSVAVIDRISC